MKLLLLLAAAAVGLASGGTQQNTNTNSYKREASTAVGGSSNTNSNTAQLVYSTLPDDLAKDAGTNFNFQEQGKNAGQHAQQQQLQPFVYHEPQPQMIHQFPQQPFPQQHQQPLFPFPENNGFGGPGQEPFGLQPFPQFDGSLNEIQQEEDSPGFLSSTMSLLLESSGLSGLWARMREMWSSLTGGSSELSTMSRVMMGAMALPFMLPMAAVPLGLGAMALMSFPVLQLTLPGIRRSLGRGAALSRSVLVSEECMERLSCNLAKVANKFPYDGSIFSRFERSENRWLNRVSKSVKAARTGEDCKRFRCSPVARMQNIVKSYLGLGGVAKEDEKEESDAVNKRELGNKTNN